ncbi:AraC family transcriptional regulator [Metapseudomonas otitidis]|uniref:AraC family transcriptional regulator n=1 Tax=Metapseudomonas otitidis TaxID=319939 RepID=UPI002449CB5F|nr:AraC family transcriptional regulator [Pseudomonas otitidis]MDH1105725.1 AraC family transcriptional regulator [Pseudomonas otitidis]MDH1166207.1 AraC family transcriptional regulator [Pseudomonas otitidis]MEE1891513.1 AraC family transcriptional regulator [Pseudomonas otitidis]
MSPPATPSGHASVSASLTQAVLHAAVALGLPRATLLQDSGLADADLNDPDARIPFTRQEALWHSIARHLDAPEPGLALGRALAPGQFSVLGYLLQSSPTLGEALEAELRYQRLVGEGGTLVVDARGDELWTLYRPLDPRAPATRPRVLALMAFWVGLMRPLLDDLRLLRATFQHPAPADLAPYQACFGCPLIFDAADYALVLPLSLRQTPLKQANPPLQAVLRQHAEALLARLPSEGLRARVVALLGAQLAHGEPDRAALASALGLSERTLQRRLAEEGSSYQHLLIDTRRQLAERHLQDADLPIAEIALLLGYSEPSVFFRAFRQWTGMTPGEYRQARRQAAQA